MDRLDKLTPVIILITGTIINHVCKEKKELNLSDVLLYLSPSIPTIMPILIDIFKDFLKNISIFFETFKTLEYMSNFLLILEFFKTKEKYIDPKINDSTQQNNLTISNDLQSNDSQFNNSKLIQVEANLSFVQFLVSYIENNSKTCSYEIEQNSKKYQISKDKKIMETEIWKNININYNNINIYLETLKIDFKKSYGKIMINSFSYDNVKKSSDEIAKYTKLSDFIKNDSIKKKLAKFVEFVKKHAISTNFLDLINKFKSRNTIEYPLVECVGAMCPNLDKITFLIELYAILYYMAPIQILNGLFLTPYTKVKKIFLFDETSFENFPVAFTNYCLDGSTDNVLYSITYRDNSYGMWEPNTNDEKQYFNDILANVNFKVAREELNKSNGVNVKNFIFNVKSIEPIELVEPIESIESIKQINLNKSRIIFSEFENFIERCKNHDFIQNSENKIKMFNTSIKRETEEKINELNKVNPNTHYDKNNQKLSETNDKIDTKKEETKTETKTDAKTEEIKSDDKTNVKTEEDIVKKMNHKKKKNKHDKDNFDQMYYYGSNIYQNHWSQDYYQNHCQNLQKKEIPVVVTEEINEKYKSIDTLYLRENDYKKLVNVLSRFKNCGHLYEKYGLPNKLGILLHGHPGTGKSTTIQVIGSYLQKNVYCVDLSSVQSNEELQMIFDEINNALGGGIIVFEDIDAMTSIVHNRKNNNVSEGAKLTLDYFLNLLQGSLTRDGTIFIATTNHIEKLDPAFYRIGRFDVNIEMKKCDSYQIATIFEKFVGRHIDKETLNKIESEKFTPAEIIFHLVNFIDSDEPDDEIMKNFYYKNNLIESIC